jgi:hypothetical protein
MKNHQWVHWIALICGGLLMISLLCGRRIVRKVPYNYIMLGIFTIIWSYMVAGFTSYADPKVVLVAAVCSVAMWVGLTAMACLVKTERFGYCFGFLSVLVALVLPAVLFMIMFRNRVVQTAVILIVVLLFSFYIVFDTKQIMKTLTIDEYIIGSLLIYVDVI